MTTGDNELSDCLERVRQRDEAAARALVERIQPLVEKLVRAHLPRNDDVEDLMQDVFLKLFSRLGQYRGQVPFEHWVSRVAVSTCIDRLRAQKRRPVTRWTDLSEGEQKLVDSLAAEVPAGAPERDAWGVMEKLLAALSPAERLIISLADLEQRTIREICEITGWNSGVVRIRTFRARQKLKSLYRQLEAERS